MLEEDMDFKSTIKMIQDAGFDNYGRDHSFQNSHVVMLGRKSIEGPTCKCDERCPELLVRFQDGILGQMTEPLIEFKITGSLDNWVWINAGVLSVTSSDFLKVLPLVNDLLSGMWQAANAVKISYGSELRKKKSKKR